MKEKKYVKREHQRGRYFLQQSTRQQQTTPLCNAREMIDCGRMDSKRLSKEQNIEKKTQVEKKKLLYYIFNASILH